MDQDVVRFAPGGDAAKRVGAVCHLMSTTASQNFALVIRRRSGQIPKGEFTVGFP